LALDHVGQFYGVVLVLYFAAVLLWEDTNVALLISFGGYLQ
jgi:hypothetical protein